MRTDFKVGETIEELKLDMSDEEMLALVKKWDSMSVEIDGTTNKDYYKGIDKKAEDLEDDRSKTVDNRIFTNIETIIPLVTSSPAKPVVVIPTAQGNGKNLKEKREQKLRSQKILTSIYDELGLQFEYEKMVRQHQIYKIGVIKYGIKDDKIFAKSVLPSRLKLDKEATTQEDSEFVGEKVVETASKLAAMYPDKKEEISRVVSGKMGTKLTYIEWWTDEYKVVSIGTSVILEKKKNPLFHYEGDITEDVNEFGDEIEKTTKNNFFNTPQKPYLFFNIYNLGESIIDDTTTLEQSKTLQDNINDRKRQIADNADKTGNPIRTYEGFTKEQADEANEYLRAGDGIYVNEGQRVSYVQAAAVPATVFNDLQDSRNGIDNIFGIHSTTRGERQGGESGKAREQLRSGDEDRQATIGRAIERISEELYNAFAHLVKVFYDKPHLVPVLGEEGTDDYIEFKRDDIAEGMMIRVKPGSTVPIDPNAIKAQGLELAQLGKVTNRRLYEMLGVEDVEGAVKELELEEVKAQKEQQKILQEEQATKSNEALGGELEQEIQSLT